MSHTDTDSPDEPLTLEDILRMRPTPDEPDVVDDLAEAKTALESLLTPRARLGILQELIHANKMGEEPLTQSNLTDRNARVSRSAFYNHIDALLDYGVVEETDKVGNARRFRVVTEHPAVQALAMLDNIMMWGQTPQMLDDQFIAPDDADGPVYEDGDADHHEASEAAEE
jgi:DNA-binding transcriptional ArsR family regulator